MISVRQQYHTAEQALRVDQDPHTPFRFLLEDREVMACLVDRYTVGRWRRAHCISCALYSLWLLELAIRYTQPALPGLEERNG